jgi:hypothetical protein
LPEECCILFFRVLVFIRQLRVQIDGLDWADDEALLAFDADVRVDVELRRGWGGVNTLNRADLYAGSILDADVSDNEWHLRLS